MLDTDYKVENLKDLQEYINRLNPVDLAERFIELDDTELVIWIKLLNKGLLADTFAELPKDNKIKMIELLSDERIGDLIKKLDEDELVDTLQELPANMVRKMMTYLVADERRDKINELLGYPEDSVGSIMSVNFLSIMENEKPRDALDKIRTSDLDASRLEIIWITDSSLILKGYAYLADIVRKEEGTIQECTYPITVSVYAKDDQELVAKLAYKYDLAEIPVTDSEGRLIGIVPAEWAIDVLHEEHEEDLANMHGIQDSSDEDDTYLNKSSFQIAKDRTMWLVICLVTASITGFIIHRYEAILAAHVILTAYIPMLMDSGGNAGTQSSTTVIRSLYAGEVNYKEILKVMFKELKIGFITGLALLAVNMIRMFVIDDPGLMVNLTVSITLLLTVMLSKVVGGMLPLIADKVKIDPTIMAGPLITTIVDTVALLIYFEVASVLLGL